jgi:hypothetical protein
MITPAKAAAESSKHIKKKKSTGNSSNIADPRSSSQVPPNMSDDPGRKVAW